MSFFQSYTSEPITGEFEAGGGSIAPIPKDTQVLAAPDEVKMDSFNDEPEYVSIRWSVMQPKEYENRKIFQKIRINDTDEKKKDKAMRMLLAIDANAGGKILASGQYPTDASLAVALMNKPQVLKLDVWEMNGKEGNWIKAVSPYKKQAVQTPVSAPIADDLDTIPF